MRVRWRDAYCLMKLCCSLLNTLTACAGEHQLPLWYIGRILASCQQPPRTDHSTSAAQYEMGRATVSTNCQHFPCIQAPLLSACCLFAG